jgi:predicted transcriptional regulator
MKNTYTCMLLTLLMSPSIIQTAQTPQNMRKDNQTTLMKIASAFILSRAIHVTAELKLADYMADGPQHITTLAQQSNLKEETLYRLLRYLASYGIFSHDAHNNFSLTPLAQELVSTDTASLWSWVAYHNDNNRWQAYGDMKYCIETGKPGFDHVFGKGYFNFLSENPVLGTQFDEGMQNLSQGENKCIAQSYDFNSYATITDIGGGKGGLLAEIILNQKSSAQKGIIFDLPYVEKSAQEYIQSINLSDKISFVPSTGFFEVPYGSDIYILKRILHDWNDADCVTILKQCYNAMQQDSRLLIIETIVAEENIRDFSKDIDIAMMVLFGGKERTEKEWHSLLEQANLELITIYTTPSLLSILEIRKQ